MGRGSWLCTHMYHGDPELLVSSIRGLILKLLYPPWAAREVLVLVQIVWEPLSLSPQLLGA